MIKIFTAISVHIVVFRISTMLVQDFTKWTAQKQKRGQTLTWWVFEDERAEFMSCV